MTMPALGENVVVAAFGLWAVCCVIVYVPRLGPIVRSLNQWYVLPEWRFFAPMPGQSDYHLLYKDWFSGGQSTEWTEVTSVRQRPYWSVVWNPSKRAHKALLDTVTELARDSRTIEAKLLIVAASYLNILVHVSSLKRSVSPEFVQFLLMQSHGADEHRSPQIMFTSERHKLC